MGRTRKDSQQSKTRRAAVHISRRKDGSFDLFLKQELCLRFGFCGEEYASIQREIEKHGQMTIVLPPDRPK